jgi:hypothetical protein
MRRALCSLAVMLVLSSVLARSQADPILGAKVYRPVRASGELVQFAKLLGVNTVFVGDELAHSQPFREACRRAGLKYFLIIRTFNDPEAAQQDPTLVSIDREGRPARRGDDVMICPSRADFRQAKLRRIKAALEELKPDGVTLDYFRYFIYWEAVDPQKGPGDFPAFCFDRACLRDFIASGGANLHNAVVADSREGNRPLVDQIWREHREAWYEWRVHRLERNAQEMTGFIRKEFPGLPIVLHAVPWTRDEFSGAREKIVGQDFRLLAPYFDYVSPMAYSALTHRGPGWVENLNRSLLSEVPASKLLPSIEVGPDGPEFPPMPPAHYESDLNAALASKTGVVLYHLELLLNDSEKQTITRRTFKGLH